MKKSIKSTINKLPYVRGLYAYSENFKRNSCYPAGHFYSPIVNMEEIKENENDIWRANTEDHVNGINLNTAEQIELLREFNSYYTDLPFKNDKVGEHRYYFNNPYYSYSDGLMLYNFMRHFKPKRIIEVGSGFSSALMLDVNDLFFNNEIKLTFVEPYPERLNSLLTEKDKKSTKIIEGFVQKVNLDDFKQLESGDILFIDSTHVSKTGSDVNFILFEILPVLKKGVIIHFHDVFFPFEYPKEWVYEGRNWNEDYILRSFLMYNSSFKIKAFTHYLHLKHKEVFSEMPLAYNNLGGNIWIEKTS